VPQGTVLDPILFLIYINNIEHVRCGETKLQLFADDMKLYSNVNIEDASLFLQRTLDNLVEWANDWQLSVNISKCAVISLSLSLSLPLSLPPSLSLSQVNLSHVFIIFLE
jgi:hypothetical protein